MASTGVSNAPLELSHVKSRLDHEKMVALLFAVSAGAEWILITDNVHEIEQGLIEKAVEGEFPTGLVYREQTLFQPCHHFLSPDDSRSPSDKVTQFTVEHVSQRSIFLPVYDSPKVQASSTERNSQNAFDARAPVPFVMAGRFASTVPHNMLVPREAFWALALSLATNGAGPREMGGLILQRLLWETNQHLGFLPIEVKESPRKKASDLNNRSSSSSSSGGGGSSSRSSNCATSNREYETSPRLSDAAVRLANWHCRESLTWLQCAHELITSFPELSSEGGSGDLLRVWFNIMEELRVTFTKRDAYSFAKFQRTTRGTRVSYSPRRNLRSNQGPDSERDAFKAICSRVNSTYRGVRPTDYKIKEIVLVVVFNWAEYVRDIPMLETVYGRHFQHVVYCSESLAVIGGGNHVSRPHVTMVEVNHFRGHRGYECTTEVMKMNYNVKGYFQMSDDVLLNVWNIQKMPLDKAWFPRVRSGHVEAPTVTDIDKGPGWIPWNFDVGRPAAAISLRGLQSLTSHPVLGKIVRQFLGQVQQSTKCAECVLYEASDAFYVPEIFKFEFLYFMKIFSGHKLFLEIAVPTALVGLASVKGLHKLDGQYSWYEDRERYEELYKPHALFYHAWKLSRIQDEKGARFYCDVFLANLEEDLKSLAFVD